jgi:hypothetical protein
MAFALAMLLFQAFTYERNVGVVYSAGEKVCIAIDNNELAPDTRVQIVMAGKKQGAFGIPIRSAGCPEFGNLTGTRYELAAETKLPLLGIVVVYPMTPLVIDQGVVRGDIDGDKKEEYFRSCTSTEGIHFTIWAGKPLKSHRRWHAYVYLGYDLEPTCTDKDY